MEENKKIKIENMNSIKARVNGWVVMEDALLNCPIGSKAYLKNKDVVTKYCYNRFIDKIGTILYVKEILDEVEEIQIPEYTRVVKSKGETLNKEEKEYLNGVIAPFRSKVVSIGKIEDAFNCEWLYIRIKEGNSEYEMNFPSFKTGTKYKGMDCRPYTLRELGLEGE